MMMMRWFERNLNLNLHNYLSISYPFDFFLFLFYIIFKAYKKKCKKTASELKINPNPIVTIFKPLFCVFIMESFIVKEGSRCSSSK